MTGLRRLSDFSLRTQLILVFTLLATFTTAISTITLTSLASRRMYSVINNKSLQYARELQQQLQSVVAFDDRLTARELFESLIGDHDIDGLAVYASDGTLIEGRGSRPPRLTSLRSDLDVGKQHVVAIAGIRSREGKEGRLYVSLTTGPIDELQRRDAWIATAIAAGVLFCALCLAVQTARRIARRLADIADAAGRMASGDRTHTDLHDRGQDEIGALARAFNRMISALNDMSDEHEQLVTTERERLEGLVSERTKDVEQSREMFRLMAESTNAIPFTLDLARGCFPYIGATAVAESGLCEPGLSESDWRLPGALDKVFPRQSHAEVRDCFDACVDGPFDFVTAQPRRGNLQAEVRWSGTCDAGASEKYLRGLMLDVTELRRLSREHAASQKLESVGRLAAGVAHEINTPVQFVADNVQFVRTSIVEIEHVVRAYRALRTAVEAAEDPAGAAQRAADAERKADLDYLLENLPLSVASSIEGLDRIATIVRSMKEFAHPDQAEKSLADLNQAVKSTLVIAHNEYKYVAALDAVFGDLPLVPCYLGEINQVLLNLLVNASHAMAEVAADGAPLGTLTVRTRHTGNEVEISIGDTGGGIPQSVRDKIFEPFFTTKPVGKGTGQGLAIARSVIVKKHAGTLRFETEMGEGTTFFIRLPIDQTASAQAAA